MLSSRFLFIFSPVFDFDFLFLIQNLRRIRDSATTHSLTITRTRFLADTISRSVTARATSQRTDRQAGIGHEIEHARTQHSCNAQQRA